MNDIYQTAFMRYVRSMAEIEPDVFRDSYGDFKRELPSIADSEDNYATKFRILNDLLSMLKISAQTLHVRGKRNISVVSCLKSSIHSVETELRLLDKRIANPELFVTTSQPGSPLRWLHRAIDLSELLTYLDSASAFGHTDGRCAPFTEVVRGFENLLNIRLGDPRDVKRSVLQRKYKQTAYLEKLISQNSK